MQQQRAAHAVVCFEFYLVARKEPHLWFKLLRAGTLMHPI